MPKTSPLPEAQKLLGLEGLRFLATIAVLLWHYQHFAFGGGPRILRSELPFYQALFPFYEAGEYGVWFFWCISGFIFFWKYRAVVADRTIDGRTFFIYRLSRLYPLHIATLLLVTVLQPVYFAQHGFYFVYQNNDAPHFITQLFMASDWLPPRSESFNGPIWSVSVEILDYAIFFLALRFVTASPLFNLVIILASITTGTQLGTSLAFFYAGGLAAIARQAVADSRHRRMLEAMAASAAIAVPAALWLADIELVAVAGPLLLTYAPILLFCCSGRPALPRRIETLLEVAGNMTYSCYLLHFPIQLAIALAYAAVQRPIPYGDHLFWAAFVLPTLVASRLTYRWFEAPAQRLIRSTLLRKKEAGRTSPAPL
ncbi:acyltransferase [Bradyrhizobium sacchari]|uniref:Peptidoglycan/LPS O-acetylase OafA/YrhL n=1 Tax=Bradyrhizobium sacchari TaxID=1399419 RepID=A0A560JVR3_9BRAD|nr:acyltransferase [Bradyrhizobium sacchari]OPY94223.1 acyltransferase [Bradyrhizobium sacchari]TWB59250.1 peptidoglycan/LPS O-acetylase OafA/YrhL [Bradyrhizobium sacchari]TWB72390.1 peptidoglycan/LPS O-acetylase OafA/YrhL [Bradyrhizobium sacchari]